MLESERDRLVNMESLLRQAVVGQDAAIEAVANAVGFRFSWTCTVACLTTRRGRFFLFFIFLFVGLVWLVCFFVWLLVHVSARSG